MVLSCAVLGVCWAPPADAHAYLLSSNPSPGSIHRAVPDLVEVVFTEPLEEALSRISLEDSSGRSLVGGEIDPGSNRTAVIRPPEGIAGGVYRIHYKVVGTDGHPIEGSYLFAIWPKGSPRPAGLGDLDDVSETTSAGGRVGISRGLVLVGSLPLAGLLLAPLLLGGDPRRRWRIRLVNATAAVAVLGDVLLLVWALDPDEALRTAYGRAVVAHLGLVAVAWVLSRSRWRVAPAVVAAGMVFPLTLTGHANAVIDGRIVSLGIDWVHLTASSLWLGGLLHLLALLPEGRERVVEEATQWRNPALVSAAVVVGTGIYKTNVAIPALDAFLDDPYGRALGLKILLVVAVLGLAARVSWRVRRGDGTRVPRSMAIEGAGFAAVLVLASVVASLPTPRPPAPPTRAPFFDTAVLGDRLFAVVVAPYHAGANTLHVVEIREGGELGVEPEPLRAELHVDDGREQVPLQTEGDRLWSGTVELAGRSPLRLGLAMGDRTWTTTLEPRRPDASLRIGSLVSLTGATGSECFSRLVGQILSVAVGPEDVELVVRSAGDDPSATVRRLVQDDGVDAVLGSCGADAHALGPATDAGIPVVSDASDAAHWSVQAPARETASMFAGFLARFGTTRVVVLVDGTPRARAFADGFTGSGIEVDVLVDGNLADAHAAGAEAVVVAGGWAQLDAVVAEARETGWSPQRGIFLAPWHLNADLLEPPAGEAPPNAQLTLGLSFDPLSLVGRTYTTVVRKLTPSLVPTSSGLLGYMEAGLAAALARAADPEDGTIRVVQQIAEDARMTFDMERRHPVPAVQFFTPGLFQWLPTDILTPISHEEHPWFENGHLSPVSEQIGGAPREFGGAG